MAPSERDWDNAMLSFNTSELRVYFAIVYKEYTPEKRKTVYNVAARELRAELLLPKWNSITPNCDKSNQPHWNVDTLDLNIATSYYSLQGSTDLLDSLVSRRSPL